jgi:hypothetical protein
MDDEDDEGEQWEEQTCFVGPCTCDHGTDAHGWGSCGVEMPGEECCPCEAGWEE